MLCFSRPGFAQPEKTIDQKAAQNELIKAIKEAIKQSKTETPTQNAEAYYEFTTTNKPCPHCPEYLKLIREVNKIVEKTPAEKSASVSELNESMVQLNRLKFMYYETKIIQENGGEVCMQYQHSNPLNQKLYNEDNTILVAEEMLSLSSVTSFQYIPAGNEKEIRYYYKGTGSQSDVIVEVILYPNEKAVLRYLRLKDSSFNLPDLGSSTEPSKINVDLAGSILNLGTAIKGDKKIGETILEQDIPISDQKGSVQIIEGINLETDTNAKLNKQTVGLSLNDGSRDILKVDVEHKTLKQLEVTTVIPMALEIDDSGLKVGGAVTLDTKKDYDGETTQTKTVSFALTDHNHEYFNTAITSSNNVDQVTLSSRYSLGGMGSVSGMAISDSTGRKEYSIAHGISDHTSSMTTRMGMSADARRFFELQREQKIGKNQTMVFTVRTDSNHETTFMYQYKINLN